jgi:hypothetical protein
MTKLRKLILLEKAYDSIYDLNNYLGYKLNDVLTTLEKEAKDYGYQFKLNSNDKFKLKSMTKKEFEDYKNEK